MKDLEVNGRWDNCQLLFNKSRLCSKSLFGKMSDFLNNKKAVDHMYLEVIQ